MNLRNAWGEKVTLLDTLQLLQVLVPGADPSYLCFATCLFVQDLWCFVFTMMLHVAYAFMCFHCIVFLSQHCCIVVIVLWIPCCSLQWWLLPSLLLKGRRSTRLQEKDPPLGLLASMISFFALQAMRNSLLSFRAITLKSHQKHITGLAFSAKLNILVSSGADAQVCLTMIYVRILVILC